MSYPYGHTVFYPYGDTVRCGRLNLQLFAGEKTEEATPRRRQDARKKGQVVKSQELNAAVNLLALTVLLWAGGNLLIQQFRLMMVKYVQRGATLLSLGELNPLLFTALGDFFLLTAPIFLVAVVAGLAVNYLQVGFLFSTESLTFKPERLNPLEGFQKLASKRALFELAKTLLKFTLVGTVAFLFVQSRLEIMLLALYQDAVQLWQTAAKLILDLSMRVGAVFFSLSVADYLYQRYEHNTNLRMTKQEVKDEYRQMEGDPRLKARIREQQRKVAMERMIQDVPRATVVITNPTTLAVALRYQEDEDRAPVVVAKGAALIAQKIREKALEHKVPLVENKAVARLLFEQVGVGEEIPLDLYQAVAEVLALVYRLKKV